MGGRRESRMNTSQTHRSEKPVSISFQAILDWLEMPFATQQTHVHGLVSVEDRENLQRQQSPPADHAPDGGECEEGIAPVQQSIEGQITLSNERHPEHGMTALAPGKPEWNFCG